VLTIATMIIGIARDDDVERHGSWTSARLRSAPPR
jgi:hypothetical protein